MHIGNGTGKSVDAASVVRIIAKTIGVKLEPHDLVFDSRAGHRTENGRP